MTSSFKIDEYQVRDEGGVVLLQFKTDYSLEFTNHY